MIKKFHKISKKKIKFLSFLFYFNSFRQLRESYNLFKYFLMLTIDRSRGKLIHLLASPRKLYDSSSNNFLIQTLCCSVATCHASFALLGAIGIRTTSGVTGFSVVPIRVILFSYIVKIYKNIADKKMCYNKNIYFWINLRI